MATQETEIKVRIDDNEAIESLREMLALAQKTKDSLGNLSLPAGGGGGTGSYRNNQWGTDLAVRYRQQKDQEEAKQKEIKDTIKKHGKGIGRALVDQISAGFTAGGFTQMMGEQLSNIGKSINVPVLGALATGAGELMKLKGKSLSMRQQLAGQSVGLESAETMLLGVSEQANPRAFSEKLSKTLAPLGYSPQQARQLAVGAHSAFGMKGDPTEGQFKKLAIAEKLGIPSAVLATLAGEIAQATETSITSGLDNSLGLRNIAEQDFDLRGQGVTRFLSTFAGLSREMTQSGITLNVEGFAKAVKGISDATGSKGDRPMMIAQTLRGVGKGALGDVQGPFQALAQSAVKAQAMESATDMFSYMTRLEEIQNDPLLVSGAVRKAFGGGAGGKTVMGALVGTRDAKDVLKAGKGKLSKKDRVREDLVKHHLRYSGAQAEVSRAEIEAGRGTEGEDLTGLNIKILEVGKGLTEALLKFSDSSDKIVDIADGFKEAVKKLEKYLP
jgi:hypothetical protein